MQAIVVLFFGVVLLIYIIVNVDKFIQTRRELAGVAIVD